MANVDKIVTVHFIILIKVLISEHNDRMLLFQFLFLLISVNWVISQVLRTFCFISVTAEYMSALTPDVAGQIYWFVATMKFL